MLAIGLVILSIGLGGAAIGAAVAARHGAESATVLLGVDGILEGERRRARFVAGNRGVPAMTVGVGQRAAIEAAVAEVDAATRRLLESLTTTAPPKDRDVEAAKARARAEVRYARG